MILYSSQIIVFILVLIIGFFNRAILGCSCSEKRSSLSKDFEKTEYIFVGFVKNVTITWRNGDTEASRDVQLHIGEVFKQPSSMNSTSITIYTPKDRSGCGINMKLNERWQVWATYTNMFSDDDMSHWLTVDTCGRTTKIYNRNLSRLRQLSTMKYIS
ncbi:unnamed protein product [Adineta steineri]|uniref:NTR domain-containing protein n=2 Tax=Adineta steineri TaxID=433720 RepID=A0A818QJM2_9BILA|nr:unnamed protein product [Adineta steineri]CAF3641310.1 unnamed protein product [Adineta steineri]CAF4060555.1 unnamed protein product [Adineta steineri]